MSNMIENDPTTRFRRGAYDGVLEHLSSMKTDCGKRYVMWDLENEDEVLEGKQAFEDAIGRGAKVFISSKNAHIDGTQVESFDPQIRHLQVVPRMAGG